MCGRYTLTVSASVLAEVFDVDPPSDLQPRFNVAPTQPVPIIRAADPDGRECVAVRWGLIPPWAKDTKIGARMINARGETLTEKPSFRAAASARRCLIPADGFYEWVDVGGRKVPHLVRFRDARVFAFAGLWERWQRGGAEPVESCAIITTTPNVLMRRLHDRMPAILEPSLFSEWLQPTPLSAARLAELLTPFAAGEMEAFAVSSYVNRPANEGSQCVARET